MDFLKLYLVLNLLLAASLVAHFFLKRVLSHRKLLPVAKALLLFSILAPIALFAVPSRHLPQLNLSEVQVLPEGALSGVRGIRRSFKEIKRLDPAVQGDRLGTESDWRGSLPYLPWLLLSVLLFGALGRSAVLAREILRLRKTIRLAFPLRSIGRIRILASNHVAVPFSARSMRRAWVVLPERMLTTRDCRIAIWHELQHHRQMDPGFALFLEALTCLFWINPALHGWKKEISETQEFSCDEAILGRRMVSSHEYGSCLVRVAEAALRTRSMYAGTTCMASCSKDPKRFQSFLGRRIQMLVVERKSPRSKWAMVLAGTLVFAALSAIAYGSQAVLRESDSGVNPGQPAFAAEIQAIAEEALSDGVIKFRAAGGFAIVADPNSGRVLAVANFEDRGGKIQKANWALSGRLEPASIAKGIVAAAALEEGLTTPEEKLSCENGSYTYHGKVYRDWSPWAQLTTAETIAKSSNICGIKLGEKLGADRLHKALVQFGFGSDGSAKDFPGARVGLLPGVDSWPDSSFVPYIATGYGHQASALEILQAYGAIANGGNLMKPIQANDSGNSGIIVRRVLSQETARTMREILRRVVTEGTGKGNAESNLYTTAGKTASSSHGKHPKGGDGTDMGVHGLQDAAGFIGFAPAVNPRVEVYVEIIDPKESDAPHGAHHAAPVFRRIVDDVLQKWNVPPDRPAAQ